MCIRILLADTDTSLLTSYRQHLEREGFEVLTAATGLDCLDQLRRFQPDLLVLEPELPWGWGEGVLTLMREGVDVPCVPVIMLCGSKGLKELYRTPAFSVISEYQVKPVTPDFLANRIRRVLEKTAPVGGFFG